MKILTIGDVVGNAGVVFLKQKLPGLIRVTGADLTVVNGENAAEIHGIRREDAEDIFSAGADVITTGNHVFGQRNVYSYLDDEKNILRPANYPGAAAGHGYITVNVAGIRVLIMNLRGNVGITPSVSCPFAAADSILKEEKGKFDVAAVDFHAEATSEKAALARYLDGRVSLVFGTHTHVATADEQILPQGTGFVTDIGMTGPTDSILGCDPAPVIAGFLTATPQKFSVAEGECRGTGALFDLRQGKDGLYRAVSVSRISF